VNIGSGYRYGLDYPMGISMQTIVDIYRLAIALEDTELTQTTETLINEYYYNLYSN